MKTLLDLMNGGSQDGMQEQGQEEKVNSDATTLDALVAQGQAELQERFEEQQADAENIAAAEVTSNFVQEDLAKAEEAAESGESHVTEQYFDRNRRVNTPNRSIFG